MPNFSFERTDGQTERVNNIIPVLSLESADITSIVCFSNILRNNFLNVEAQCSLFDTYAHSILYYACEVWGFHKAQGVENVHLMFCKNVLSVNKRTNNNLVYCELSR